MTAEEIKAKKLIKEKYGVTFHKHMDLKTMSKQWAKGISKKPENLVQYPSIVTAMTGIAVAITAQDFVIQAQVAAKKAQEAVKLTADAAGAANPITASQYIPIVSGEAIIIGTELAMKLKTEATNLATSSAVTLLSSV